MSNLQDCPWGDDDQSTDEEPAANAKVEPECIHTEEGLMPEQPAVEEPMADCSLTGEHTDTDRGDASGEAPHLRAQVTTGPPGG